MIVALGDRDTGYLTHREIDAALGLFPSDAQAHSVATDSAEARSLCDASGVWLLPGTPYRDAESAFAAIRHCLATGTPFLGTCGGFQHALVELVRSRAGVAHATHGESDPNAADPVVSRLACSLIGEVRLVTPIAGTRFASICGSEPFEGFHYCSFGLDPAYVEPLERAGVVVGATAPDAGVEAIELPEHPFFLATAFQPQVGAGARGRLGPLLESFVAASTAGCRDGR
jgi:CTP synthase (UTP-ammonia lyase)